MSPTPLRYRVPFVIAFLLCAMQAVAQTPLDTNPTHVKLKLTETVSSATAKVGQSVSFEVVDPVEVDGKVILAAGAHARASVTKARRRGHNRREGQLVLTIQTVHRVDGFEAQLQSASLQTGSGHGLPIFGPAHSQSPPIPSDSSAKVATSSSLRERN